MVTSTSLGDLSRQCDLGQISVLEKTNFFKNNNPYLPGTEHGPECFI